jgi:thiosulfate/3-mercaptopyruvate sulfurtransferase
MRLSKLFLGSTCAAAFLAAACSTDSTQLSATDPNPELASCTGCHSDYEALKTLHSPDTVMPAEGCSGPPPYVAPYDRVYLEPAGFAQFQAGAHGQMECTRCHGGVDGTSDKASAHSVDFARRPSFENLQVCSECHSDVVAGFRYSLHYNGWGQKNSQMTRAGVTEWNALHEGVQAGYEQNCATCHASCGSCHVDRPLAAGGGLMNGHSFAPPDMRDNCTQCHSSRGGHAYYGVGTGTKPDVHLTQAGYTCMDCHTTGEMHATDARIYENRYQVETLPSCKDCHADVQSANAYHIKHVNDFNCNVCHSQDYNTCGSCHVAGEGARIHSYQSFKIGVNPIRDERPYEFTTVRRTLAAPDSWEVYGAEDFTAFDQKALYNYTSPHNILRWTSRTEHRKDGDTCYSNCHIILEGRTYRNRELYLFSSDFEFDWERAAAKNVVVDGKLPSQWGKP